MTEARPRVAIDAHTVGRRGTGNETYVRALVGELIVRDDVEPLILADDGVDLPEVPEQIVRRLAIRHPVGRLLGELSSPRRRWGSELLHVQYVRPPRCDARCVTTVHDISFEHFPSYFTKRSLARMRATIPWSARRSAAVLTGSTYSRDDLIARYRLRPEKVHVTSYAADRRFRPQPDDIVRGALERFGLPRDYVLSVGNLQPRKNLPRLLEAYVRLPAGARPPLVIVGQRAWLHDEIFSSVRRFGLEGSVHFTGFVEADDLPAIYAGSLVFAYPSLFEGFGLPVLEAMACGVPTLSSRTSSIPEVAGDAAVLVDPTDVDAIAEGLSRLVSSQELRDRLRTAGLSQASAFSWARCATQTVAAYRAALA
jgi:glycosyltransferase involved in cell wall biosynthesis